MHAKLFANAQEQGDFELSAVNEQKTADIKSKLGEDNQMYKNMQKIAEDIAQQQKQLDDLFKAAQLDVQEQQAKFAAVEAEAATAAPGTPRDSNSATATPMETEEQQNQQHNRQKQEQEAQQAVDAALAGLDEDKRQQILEALEAFQPKVKRARK